MSKKLQVAGQKESLYEDKYRGDKATLLKGFNESLARSRSTLAKLQREGFVKTVFDLTGELGLRLSKFVPKEDKPAREKLNRATWRAERLRDCCALCLTTGKLVIDARKCDGIHFHEYCGTTILASKKGLSCGEGHPEESILGFIVKTYDEAARSGVRW